MKRIIEEYGRIILAVIIILIMVVIAVPVGKSLKNGVKKGINAFSENNPAYYSRITLLDLDGNIISNDRLKNGTEFELNSELAADTIWVRKSGSGESDIDESWDRELTFTIEKSQTYQLVTGWEIGAENVKNAYAILCSNGVFYVGGKGNISVSSWQNGMLWANYKSSIVEVDFSNNVTPDSLDKWFSGCENLKKISNIPNSVKSMDSTFSNCDGLVNAFELPPNVENIKGVYQDCTNLVNGPSRIPDSVINGSYAFSGCNQMITTPEISPDANLQNMQNMFAGAAIITPPVIAKNVTNITGCFYNTPNIEGIMNFYSNSITDYKRFNSYAGKKGSGVTVNYTADNAENIDTWVSWYSSKSSWHGKWLKGVQLD